MKIEPNAGLKFKAGGKFRTKDRNSMMGSNFVYISTSRTPLQLSSMQREDFPIGHGYFTGMKGNYSQYIMDPLTKQQLFDLYKPQALTAHLIFIYPFGAVLRRQRDPASVARSCPR